MRKLLWMLMCLMLLTGAASAETAEIPAEAEIPALALEIMPSTVRPGKACLISFTVPADGLCDVQLLGADGAAAFNVVTDHPVMAGANQLWWNGTYMGVPAPEGAYLLTLRCGGDEIAVPVTVGAMAPYLTSIVPVKDAEAMTVTIDFYASVDGMLTVGLWADGRWRQVESRSITAGVNNEVWDASTMPAGTTALTLTLTDATGFPSNEEHVAVSPEEFGLVFETPTPTLAPTPSPTLVPTLAPTATPEPTPEATATPEPTATPDPTPVPTPDITFTPSYGSTYSITEAEANTYWGTPMDITDEEAVWAMLSAPITVVDHSLKNQTRLYAEPDEKSRTVGVVTGQSQGVRVLENLDNGWSLVECYSSTFHDNSIEAWNMLVQGYIRTDKLITKDMSKKKHHLVIDKLTQRGYLFSEGKLMTTLLISTGVANADQPYNETRSGEFLYISPTGGFRSDNMYCPSALKFNDGDLLHEVPYIQRSSGSTRIYSTTEPYLGERASHGCIRVQRKRTPEGVNMTWIWDHRKDLGRIVVWEDWQGRQIDIPADDTVLYYNAKGGSYYHRAEKCYSAKESVKFTAFTYGELDTGDFCDLEACPYCAPAPRVAKLQAVNEAHAFGGDHDPVLTAARKKYLDKLLKTMTYEELLPCEQRYYDMAAE